jgi:hypothetical protein
MSEQATQPMTTVEPDALELAPGFEHENLEGWIPELASEEELRVALEKAFDYRGDIKLTLKDGRVIEGYVFDRRTAATLGASLVRMIPAKERTKVAVSYAEIAALAFTGRDTAAGKSFEAWMKKYREKKAAGETGIGIEPEKLD